MYVNYLKKREYMYINFVFYIVESLAKNRSRRQKVDKKGKFAAFEKLKKAKASGEKNKYEVIYIYSDFTST